MVPRHPFDPDAYRNVFDNAPIGIYRTTPDGRILFANAKALEILGYDTLEELAKSDLERDGLHADYDRVEFKRVLETKGEIRNLVSTWRRRDHSVVSISENARAVRGPNGEVLYYDGTIEDITERIRAEAQLREGRELYRHIVENATDIVYRTDYTGHFTFINARGLERIGYTEEELYGKHFLTMIAPDHRQRAEEVYRDQFRTRTQSTYYEMVIESKSGERIWIGQNVQALFDNGDISGFQAVARDISERRATELELARARDAAIESARLKSEFLANISHEIRTPMNGVIGMTNLLLGTGLDMQQYEYAQMIRSSAEALLTVVNNVLDLSKIEAGKLTLDMVDFDLDDVVESVIELFAERAAAKNLRLRQIVYPDVPRSYRGDATRLRQVLLNLVANAVKFTESGEVSLSVMRQSEFDDMVTLWFLVADTGIGIADDVQPRLFSAFTQADGTTTRQYGGTGLGLAISKELVELMGGRIGMASHVGEGSTFWFTIELERNRDAIRTRRSYDLAGMRVLLVDHNPVNRLVLRRQLAAAAVEVDEAESVDRATDLLWAAVRNDKPYAVAVVEMQMPEVGGLDLARAVRRNTRFDRTKLLLLTAIGRRKSDHEAFRDAGFDAFLLKPVRQPVLLKTIAGLIGATELPHAAEQPPATVSPLRILIVEDNAVNQHVALGQLRVLGYDAEVVENGKEAVEAVQKTAYDLIFMDCQMPIMDGYAATAAIRNLDGEVRHTPIVAMTAHALDGEREKCLAAGMDDYIAKPVGDHDLRGIIERWTRPPDPDVLDIAALQRLVAFNRDDASFFTSLLALFRKDAPERLAAMRSAMVLEDPIAFSRAAHALKSSSGNVGAKRLHLLCERAERDAKRGVMPSDVESVVRRVEREIGIAIDALSEVFERPAAPPSEFA
ncbi:MAG: response regulator [Acidobacteria bacterium]|nr:response regulator [Acidobacteriota bacterium]